MILRLRNHRVYMLWAEQSSKCQTKQTMPTFGNPPARRLQNRLAVLRRGPNAAFAGCAWRRSSASAFLTFPSKTGANAPKTPRFSPSATARFSLMVQTFLSAKGCIVLNSNRSGLKNRWAAETLGVLRHGHRRELSTAPLRPALKKININETHL